MGIQKLHLKQETIEKTMLKVLFITRKWPPAIGGMETYAVRLSDELKNISNLTTLFLPGNPSGSPPNLFKLLFFMLKCGFYVLNNRRFDVLHIGDLVLWPLAYLNQLCNPKNTVVTTAYGLDIVFAMRNGILPKIYRLYLSLGINLCKKRMRVLAISNSTAGLCRSAGFSDVHVVPLGVNSPASEDIFGPPQSYLLYVGRLVERKGCAWFINNVLPRLREDIYLVVIGKPWDRSEMASIQNNPRVRHKANVSSNELAIYRKYAIAVIMPNIHTGGNDIEGFGLTALEAGADGGVLLASGIEGIVDAVIDGKTGFLLPSGDPEAWEMKIAEVERWPIAFREEFICNAQEAIRDRFSWRRVAQNTLNCYPI